MSQGHTEIDCLVVFPARIPSPDVNPSELVALPRPKVSVLFIHSFPHTALWSTFDVIDEIIDVWTPLCPLYDTQIHPTSLVGQQFISGIFCATVTNHSKNWFHLYSKGTLPCQQKALMSFRTNGYINKLNQSPLPVHK